MNRQKKLHLATLNKQHDAAYKDLIEAEARLHDVRRLALGDKLEFHHLRVVAKKWEALEQINHERDPLLREHERLVTTRLTILGLAVASAAFGLSLIQFVLK